MLLAPQLVFVELQKTGGTHIQTLLREFFGGRTVGKHNAPSIALINGPLPFMGSVRNPWDWYVSLWAYGCSGMGEIAARLRKPRAWDNVKYAGPAEGESPEQDAMYQRAGHQRANAFYYADVNNVEAFREWITVLMSPHFRKMVEPSYARAPISSFAGPMTFRYFKLFVKGGGDLDSNVGSVEDLLALDEKQCFINAMLRNERLEQDFFEALEAFGSPLTAEQQSAILSKERTNASVRPRSTSDYYDAASAKVVEQAEQFIIRRFGYTSPITRTTKQSFPPLVVDMRNKLRFDQRPANELDADFKAALKEAKAFAAGEMSSNEEAADVAAANAARSQKRLLARLPAEWAEHAALKAPAKKARKTAPLANSNEVKPKKRQAGATAAGKRATASIKAKKSKG